MKTKATIEHGQFITSQLADHTDLEAMGIDMAEKTAKSINADKLDPRLLEFIINTGRQNHYQFPGAIELDEERLTTTPFDLPDSKLDLSTSNITTLLEQSVSDSGPKLSQASLRTAKPSTKLTTTATLKKKFKDIHNQGLIEPSHPVYDEKKSRSVGRGECMGPKVVKGEMQTSTPSDSKSLTTNTISKKAKKRQSQKRKKKCQSQSDKDECRTDSIPPEQCPLTKQAVSNESKDISCEGSFSRQDQSVEASKVPLQEKHKESEVTILERRSAEALKPKDDFVDSNSLSKDPSAPPPTSLSEACTQICYSNTEESTERLAEIQEQTPIVNAPATQTLPRISEPDDSLIWLTPLPSPIFGPFDTTIPQDVTSQNATDVDEEIDQGTYSPSSHSSNEMDGDPPLTPEPYLTNEKSPRRVGSSSLDNALKFDERGADGLAWVHNEGDNMDEDLNDAARKMPQTTYYPHSIPTLSRNQGISLCVVICPGNTGCSEPSIEYNEGTILIIPHSEPWEDVRSQEGHPEFLPPSRLIEYQACEAAGCDVWRHDRHYVVCRKPGCNVMVMDYDPSSVFCQGCGPKASVRYCCFQHQIDDIESHWAECGDSNLVLPYVIDHDTAPAWFFNKPPAIIERNGVHGTKSAALIRQKTYAMHNCGYYTLIDPKTNLPKTLTWPEFDPQWQELDRRIERLLNIAFFNTFDLDVIRYLYRLLRELLRRSGELNRYLQLALRRQFREEFNPLNTSGQDPTFDNSSRPCECEWTGEECQFHKQLTVGFKTHADAMEMQYWILRAWRQQHPIEKNWRVRADGCGLLPLDFGKDNVELGTGWTGWGGLGNSLRGPDWAERQNLQAYWDGYGQGLRLGSSC